MIKRKRRQSAKMEEVDGDFLESCLPTTYKYFTNLDLETDNQAPMDAFDALVKERVPLLKQARMTVEQLNDLLYKPHFCRKAQSFSVLPLRT